MAIFTGILRKMPELRNPTIVVQVDRRDLDNQLFDNFRLAKDLVGDIDQAQSTDDLRELLNTEGGGVVFSTIEKFRIQKEKGEYEHPVLSDRHNIVVIADEAHRTQYGLLDGLAANLRIALPNASFIGYTGTPVDKKDADTIEVFGNLIHVYDILQAVQDRATVPIYYEPRLAKLHLNNEGIDEEAEEIAGGEQEGEAHLKWAALEDAAGAEERVQKIAEDILKHYLERTSILPGKAMIVCMSRRNCVKLYDAITKLPNCPETAVVMTSNIAKDPKDWNKHIRTKEAMEGIKQRFKNPDDPLKIVIVRDMWLTGFDNPSLHTMYVDKVMHDHNLMQAIARVNRVFKDKPSGLIVDYIGIGNRLRDATTKYTRSGGKGTPTEVIERALSLFYEQLEVVKALLPYELDYSAWRRLTDGEKLKLVSSAVNHIVKDDETTDTYLQEEKKLETLLTIVMAREEIRSFAVDIAFIQHTTVAAKKIKYPLVGIKKKEEQIKELISRSIDSEDIVDVYATAGLEKPDISILDDKFLAGAKASKEGSAIKVELLRQLLRNEINARLSRNIHKYRSLKEEVEKIIDRYHKNAIDSFTAIAELVNQAKEIQNEDRRAQELGLSEEELAFYDIIAHHEGAIKEHGRIKEIVQNVVKAVTKNLQLDWYKKENAKAAIRLAVKKELRGKVHISELNEIMAEIIEQVEGQYKDWPNQLVS
jgi:type I restriction enzyme R subunit